MMGLTPSLVGPNGHVPASEEYELAEAVSVGED
jgi:hypothetical protein